MRQIRYGWSVITSYYFRIQEVSQPWMATYSFETMYRFVISSTRGPCRVVILSYLLT
jgi:hypothetical protein